MGGLVFYLAGRVPGRGEVIRHESGIEFEILEADPEKSVAFEFLSFRRMTTNDCQRSRR